MNESESNEAYWSYRFGAITRKDIVLVISENYPKLRFKTAGFPAAASASASQPAAAELRPVLQRWSAQSVKGLQENRIMLSLFDWKLLLFLTSCQLISAAVYNIAKVDVAQRYSMLPPWFGGTGGPVFLMANFPLSHMNWISAIIALFRHPWQTVLTMFVAAFFGSIFLDLFVFKLKSKLMIKWCWMFVLFLASCGIYFIPYASNPN
jgi:hypothetical protein